MTVFSRDQPPGGAPVRLASTTPSDRPLGGDTPDAVQWSVGTEATSAHDSAASGGVIWTVLFLALAGTIVVATPSEGRLSVVMTIALFFGVGWGLRKILSRQRKSRRDVESMIRLDAEGLNWWDAHGRRTSLPRTAWQRVSLTLRAEVEPLGPSLVITTAEGELQPIVIVPKPGVEAIRNFLSRFGPTAVETGVDAESEAWRAVWHWASASRPGPTRRLVRRAMLTPDAWHWRERDQNSNDHGTTPSAVAPASMWTLMTAWGPLAYHGDDLHWTAPVPGAVRVQQIASDHTMLGSDQESPIRDASEPGLSAPRETEPASPVPGFVLRAFASLDAWDAAVRTMAPPTDWVRFWEALLTRDTSLPSAWQTGVTAIRLATFFAEETQFDFPPSDGDPPECVPHSDNAIEDDRPSKPVTWRVTDEGTGWAFAAVVPYRRDPTTGWDSPIHLSTTDRNLSAPHSAGHGFAEVVGWIDAQEIALHELDVRQNNARGIDPQDVRPSRDEKSPRTFAKSEIDVQTRHDELLYREAVRREASTQGWLVLVDDRVGCWTIRGEGQTLADVATKLVQAASRLTPFVPGWAASREQIGGRLTGLTLEAGPSVRWEAGRVIGPVPWLTDWTKELRRALGNTARPRWASPGHSPWGTERSKTVTADGGAAWMIAWDERPLPPADDASGWAAVFDQESNE